MLRNLLILTFIICAGLVPVSAFAEIKTEEDLYPMIEDGGKDCETALEYIRINRPSTIILRLVDEILKRDDDPREQRYFLNALQIYPVNEVLQPWLEVMNGTRRYELKEEILGIVGDINSRELVIPLAQLLRSPVSSLRAKAVQTLVKVGDDRMYPYILRLGESTNPVYRIYCLEALTYLYDKRFFPVVLSLLKDENKSIRIYTLDCLYRNNLRETLPAVRDMAAIDPDRETRIRAIDILGDFNDDKALYVLLKTLYDADRNVRLASVRALNKLQQASSANVLAARLVEENDREIRDGIIEVLIVLRKAGDIRSLQKVLFSDPEEGLRIKAAYTLGIIRDERAPSILAGGMKDKSFRVRGEICAALSVYRARIVTDTLVETVKHDTEIYVRTAALYGLLSMKDRKMLVPLFDIFAIEKDPLFRDILRINIRKHMDQYL